MIHIIIQNCNLCKLEGDINLLRKLYEEFKIKHPNAWHIQMYSKTKWDGYIKYINANGTFKVGLLQSVYNAALKLTDKVIIDDRRRKIGINPIIPKQVGNLTLRPDQYNAIKNILSNKIGGIPFLVCSANLSVNFGKSLVFASIYLSYKSKVKSILLLDDADLFEQFKTEFPKLLPNEKITFVRGNNVYNWENFTIGMVQSISKNIQNYKEELESREMVLIDEADIIDNKTYQNVLMNLYNTTIRIGLSGTLYKGKLKKHLTHNMNVRCYIGDMVEEVKLVDQIKKGYSTPVVIKVIYCNYPPIEEPSNYHDEYKYYVLDNPMSYETILNRVNFNLSYGRIPMMVYAKYIEHANKIGEYLKKHLKNLKIEVVTHKSGDRAKILQKFREGGIDILVATVIISRGKNLPLLQYTCNVASMDAEEKTIQTLGRSTRKHISKTKAYLDDIVFPGRYNVRHGNHRKNYYLREDLKVITIPRKKSKKRKK